MLTHLVLGCAPGFDEVFTHVPPVGRHRRAPRVLPEGGRLIKSHERRGAPRASSYRKAVYLVRDGRDVSISYYGWCSRNGLYAGSFEDFLPLFLAGRLEGYGSWQDHVRSWLTSALAREGALLLVRYEDLVARPAEGLERIAAFMGLDASRELIEEAVASSTPEVTRGRPRRKFRRRARRATDGTDAVAGDRTEAAGGAPSGDRRRTLTPQESRLFEGVAGDVLADLGYEQEGPPGAIGHASVPSGLRA